MEAERTVIKCCCDVENRQHTQTGKTPCCNPGTQCGGDKGSYSLCQTYPTSLQG